MDVTIQARCPKCRSAVTVHEHLPAALPDQCAERVTMRGHLCVVMAELCHETADGYTVTYELTRLEPAQTGSACHAR